jgi:dynactin complex subunit
MQLSRLQELLATQETAELIAEGKQHDKDFDGIRSIVDDCLADLKDKLGKGGNLATLMKSSGASKMDTVKDADGKNVLNQIIALTTEYTKAVAKLMTEAEMLVAQVSEGMEADGEVLLEANSDYEDSSEFTDEFYGMSQDIEKMKSKIKNPRWLKWMKVTDQNFGTDCEAPARAAIAAIGTLSTQFTDLEEELDKAS